MVIDTVDSDHGKEFHLLPAINGGIGAVPTTDERQVKPFTLGHCGIEAEIVPTREQGNVRCQDEIRISSAQDRRVGGVGERVDAQRQPERVVPTLGIQWSGEGTALRNRQCQIVLGEFAVGLRRVRVPGRVSDGRVRECVVHNDVRQGRYGALEVLAGHLGLQRREQGREGGLAETTAPLLVSERRDTLAPSVVGLRVYGSVRTVVVPERRDRAEDIGT